MTADGIRKLRQLIDQIQDTATAQARRAETYDSANSPTPAAAAARAAADAYGSATAKIHQALNLSFKARQSRHDASS